MTLPDERIRAINNTRLFLLDLIDRTQPIKVSEVRGRAGRLLRHYPSAFEMTRPDFFGWGENNAKS